MLAFEAWQESAPLKVSPLKGEESQKPQHNGISFAEFLKDVAKHSLLLTPKGEAILPAKEKTAKSEESNDPKAILLSLLQSDKPKETKESLLQLLKSDTPSPKEEFALNPLLGTELSFDELKYLMHKAKEYLKTKILQAQTQLEAKDLPKSLKGLLQLADKLNIEITKISFESITEDENSKSEALKLQAPRKQNALETKSATDKKIETKQTTTTITGNDKKIEVIQTKIQSIKTAPLFLSKSAKIDSRHIITTSQIIQSKSKQEHPKKAQATDPLLLLLKGETPTQQTVQSRTPKEESLFAFLKSDMEQKPLKEAPLFKESETKQKREESFTKGLEELLRGDSTAAGEFGKVSHSSIDALDVKVHEAKQMMKYLSQDIKKAIEEYKPPFSRVKVKLNPQRLGEMDLTVVQRGNNVHINLSSNNAALNILTNNLHELRTQLNQNGINNATFNFSSDAQQQHQKNKEQERREQYEYFANDEESEDQSRSLEIIVPKYI